MKVNIYYGGRGLIEDPTLYVINKIQDVLKELRVNVSRYNLYEQKNGISMLPNTFKEADAVILAVSVEWYGIGGLMQMFLDSCWLYADKQKLKTMYMFPCVVATTNGERKVKEDLSGAWELLGGIVCDGICTYVSNHVEFETDQVYASIIEKKAEEIYRIVSHKTPMLPNSINACHVRIPSAGIELTPQESEQLSVYVADDSFVKKQKEDVEMLSQMYKSILGQKSSGEDADGLPKLFEKAFKGADDGIKAVCCINISDMNKSLILNIDGNKLKSSFGEASGADITITAAREVITKITTGKTTFQGAFMSGLITAKGRLDFMRTFDRFFRFDR
ncbi:MAG: SCP2 sterol-binding domain-containing protein [Lachnospiraceae bacterium]|nr:SCP2 sterol-binding domain-containing protein [Lachnospiraceae bacterium]